MKKVLIVVAVCTVAVFGLQGLWMRSMYRAYLHQSLETIEQAMDASIGFEISYRVKEQPFNDPKKPKVVYKYADEMTPEERSSLKGDTLDLMEADRKNVGGNLHEIIMVHPTFRVIFV